MCSWFMPALNTSVSLQNHQQNKHYFAEFSKNGTSLMVIPRSGYWSNQVFMDKVLFNLIYKSSQLYYYLFFADNFKSNFTIRFKKISRGGKEYLEVTKFQLQFTASNAKLQFDNLFGGNKALGKLFHSSWAFSSNLLGSSIKLSVIPLHLSSQFSLSSILFFLYVTPCIILPATSGYKA